MTVSITWSESQGGTAISSPLSWGNIANGSNSIDDLYIRHDGTEKIYDCGFYIQAYTGSYTGTFDAATDYAELLTWGADDASGVSICQDADAATTYVTCKTGRGTSAVPQALTADSKYPAGGGTAEEIQTGEEAWIKVKIAVPAAEGDAGTRQFDLCLVYTYTS